MSRREHITSQSYIDWLKSMGCVFYAPLGQNDLTDYIGGSASAPYNAPSGNLTWNSSAGAYRLYSTARGHNPLRWKLTDFRTRWNNATDFTWVVDIMKIGTTTFQAWIGYCYNSNSWNQYGYPCNNLSGWNNLMSTTVFKRFALVMKQISGTVYNVIVYCDGQQIDNINFDYQGANIYIVPIGWLNSYYNYISLGSALGNTSGTDAYFKNYYWFNKALTQQEIQNL